MVDEETILLHKWKEIELHVKKLKFMEKIPKNKVTCRSEIFCLIDAYEEIADDDTNCGWFVWYV